MFLTSNPNVVNDPDYKTICEAISHLDRMGLIQRSTGHCMSICDIIQKLLTQYKIKSYLVEVKVLIFPTDSQRLYPIGFDEETKNTSQIDTHVVVVTDTSTPFLIDASVGYRLPKPFKVIIDSADKDGYGLFNINHPECKITYEQREGYKLPKLHQEYILDRIGSYRKMTDDINFIKMLIYVSIILSLFAFINVMAKILGLW